MTVQITEVAGKAVTATLSYFSGAKRLNHPLRITIHGSGRAKSNSFMYFNMCTRALVRYRQLAHQLKQLDSFNPQYGELFDLVEEASIEPIIFAGMSLESTLYDLMACFFDNQKIKLTEKLDPLSKYTTLIKHIDGGEPNTSTATYQALQALVTARNKLVHHKSLSAVTNDTEDFRAVLDKAQKEHKQHIQGINCSFRALVLLSLHFDGNIFEELRILPSFKKTEYWVDIVPNELHEDVRWCIQASKKEQLISLKTRPA